jgi:hypothetical protein
MEVTRTTCPNYKNNGRFGRIALRKGKRRPLTAGQYLDLLREKSIFSR